MNGSVNTFFRFNRILHHRGIQYDAVPVLVYIHRTKFEKNNCTNFSLKIIDNRNLSLKMIDKIIEYRNLSLKIREKIIEYRNLGLKIIE